MTCWRPTPTIRFDVEQANAAGDAWGFNCGPASICAVLGLTPAEVRPHLGDFERPNKHYTNPTLMWSALRSLGVKWRKVSDWPAFGLVRVQWGGPWTAPGVPMRARYRHTHWVGSFNRRPGLLDELEVFDVNATCSGGWLPFAEWSDQLVPWLLGEVEPKADRTWWITHAVEVLCP